jgi:cell division protein FtsN
MAPSLATQTPQSQQSLSPAQSQPVQTPQSFAPLAQAPAAQGVPQTQQQPVRTVQPPAPAPQQQQPVIVPVPVPQQPAPQQQQQQKPQPAPTPQPAYSAAKVMPGMPAAGSGNYRVQVGSYKNSYNAKDMYDKLVRGGFSPQYERHEDLTRVVLQSVNSADLPEVARRLGALGVPEIWVLKEP